MLNMKLNMKTKHETRITNLKLKEQRLRQDGEDKQKYNTKSLKYKITEKHFLPSCPEERKGKEKRERKRKNQGSKHNQGLRGQQLGMPPCWLIGSLIGC